MIFQFSDGEFSDPIATSLKMWKKKNFPSRILLQPPHSKTCCAVPVRHYWLCNNPKPKLLKRKLSLDVLLASLWQNIYGEKHTNISTNRKLYKFVLLLCGQVDHMNPGRILKLIVVIVSIFFLEFKLLGVYCQSMILLLIGLALLLKQGANMMHCRGHVQNLSTKLYVTVSQSN